MRQDFFEYVPQFKPWISGNHRPGLNGVNEAIRRRFNMLPFNVTIPEEKRDKDLPEKLKIEWPGILLWMIEGCLEWQRTGLKPPQVVTDATAEYLKTENKLERWIDECCERDVQAWTSSTDLYHSWGCWADFNKEFVGSHTKFAKDMKDAGYAKDDRSSANGFRGLRLKPTTPFAQFVQF
jgi:putative DNA primase/helicase